MPKYQSDQSEDSSVVVAVGIFVAIVVVFVVPAEAPDLMYQPDVVVVVVVVGFIKTIDE